MATMIKRWSTKVLFTGAGGQVGTLLLKEAQQKYGERNVLATDLNSLSDGWNPGTIFEKLDVTDAEEVEKIFTLFKPQIIYHLASTLSAQSEKHPQLGLKVNIGGLHNILEQARNLKSTIFSASSIAAFGESSSKFPAELELQRPSTIYGITKVHLELIGDYYYNKYGVDFRCLRIPIVTSENLPGGASAAFTVTMFYDLIKTGKSIIPVSPDVRMPLIYIEDLIRSIIEFMDIDSKALKHRTYTMASIGTSAHEYVTEVLKHVPGEVTYQPDFRDKIIRSWPDGTDSRNAYKDWGHKIHYDVPKMVRIIHENITKKLKQSDSSI